MQIACEFVKVTFTHYPKEANDEEDELDRQATRNPIDLWLDEPPNFLLPMLVKGLMLVEQ